MIINLLLNRSDNNVVNKNIEEVKEYTDCIFKNEVSVMTPSIIIKDTLTVGTFNYLYIPSLNRYYYVSDIISLREGVWQLDCKCDVLMSFKDYLLNCKALIARNEYDYNLELKDNRLSTEQKVYTQTLKFNKSFHDYQIFVTMLGQ